MQKGMKNVAIALSSVCIGSNKENHFIGLPHFYFLMSPHSCQVKFPDEIVRNSQ